MKRPANSWPVTEAEYKKRPSRGRICFYCSRAVGDQHKEDCVMRSRTILVEARVRYVVKIPEDWTESDFLFHRNDGTWCGNNGIKEIAALSDFYERTDKCPDPHFGEDRIEYVFVREATKEDEEFFEAHVADDDKE